MLFTTATRACRRNSSLIPFLNNASKSYQHQKIQNASDIHTQSCSSYQKTTSYDDSAGASDSKSGWMDRIFPKRIETGTQPHSRLLSASDFIYEMHYHDSKPEFADEYIDKYETYCQELINKSKSKAELVASFRVEIGNQDQFIHIWRYHDGYKQASNIHQTIRTDKDLIKLNKELACKLNKRESQFMMSFSFWNHPMPQNLNSFYEMRSYLLKPGTMIEWANGWSKGLSHRDNSVAGFFSQIGQLYTVHHFWRYEDLQVRKHVREDAWRKPGWDECVSITVPNIVNLQTRWMVPNKFSPIR